MLNDPTVLPDDPDQLRHLVASLSAELKSRDILIEKLRHQLAGLRRSQFGARSESLDQLSLSLEDEEVRQAAEAPASHSPANEPHDDRPAKSPRRKPLPDHLPREESRLEAGAVCTDCGGSLKPLGEDVTEELEYVPGRFVVKHIVRPRCACASCEAIQQAPLPARPIERGRPGPGLLAHVLVSKYADHLPLYRQSQIHAREGVELERSTLADWVGKSTALLTPLAEAVARHVLAGPAIFADDTPVNLLAPGTGKTKTGRLWTYVRDERPWAGPAPPAVFYRFSPNRKAERPGNYSPSWLRPYFAMG
jgi:transposase